MLAEIRGVARGVVGTAADTVVVVGPVDNTVVDIVVGRVAEMAVGMVAELVAGCMPLGSVFPVLVDCFAASSGQGEMDHVQILHAYFGNSQLVRK